MKHASVDRAKRVSRSCRNHGSCPWCVRSRTINHARIKAAAESWAGDMAREGTARGTVMFMALSGS